MTKQEEPAEKKSLEEVAASLGHEDWKKIGIWAGSAVLGIALIISFFMGWGKRSQQTKAEENKELGPAYIYFSKNQMDSAIAYLEGMLQESHPPLVTAKGHLLLGKALYTSKQFDAALKAFEKSLSAGTGVDLVESGALLGKAACYMEMKNYDQSAATLESFVKQYMKRTGDMEARSRGKEPVDLSPAVPDALWKLALSYRELDQAEKARQTCERLIRVYGESEEAGKAARLMQSMQG